jgi:hypothetical protein
LLLLIVLVLAIDLVFEGDQLRSEQKNSVARKLIRARLSLGIMSAIAFVVNIVIGLPSLSQTTTPRPCDIYGSAGTPCVAAHSMTRALYAAYNGPLYQLQRASDNATQDVGLLSAGGYANAATQDSFCSGTTCNITKIYDQTSNHNDLFWDGFLPTVANAWPITISGYKAYGLQIVAGGGSGFATNNAYGNFTANLPGMPTGTQPESNYWVVSGTYYGGDCCFDYGNAEVPAGDHGQGHLDLVEFGNYCFFPPCLGTGPWIGWDPEQGELFSNSGSQINPAYTGLTYDYITGLTKENNATWAIKSGNAQSGGLTTWFSGPLAPTVACCNWPPPPPPPPMAKEGGLILGDGGDHSSRSRGVFFEGAVIAGYTTDATDNLVQADIVRARYGGRHRPRERGRHY